MCDTQRRVGDVCAACASALGRARLPRGQGPRVVGRGHRCVLGHRRRRGAPGRRARLQRAPRRPPPRAATGKAPLLTWRLAHFASAAAWLHFGLGPVHGVTRVPGAAAGKSLLLTWACSLARGRTLCLGHRDLATSEAGSGPVHGVARVPSPVWHVYLRRVGGTFGRASKLPHTSPSWQAVADEIRASSSGVIVEIVPCDLGRATGEP